MKGDCAEALEPYKVIPRADGGPFVLRRLLGWCLSRSDYEVASISCSKIAVENMQMYQTEFTENLKENRTPSVYDKKFLSVRARLN